MKSNFLFHCPDTNKNLISLENQMSTLLGDKYEMFRAEFYFAIYELARMGVYGLQTHDQRDNA